MKKTLCILMVLAITLSANAQLKVTTYGNVGIGTSFPTVKLQVDFSGSAYERAIWTRVTHPQGCSYNLWSFPKNKDVFYVCAEGWLWTEQGGYFGSDISLKKNITSLNNVLPKVQSLRGVRYQYKSGDDEENDNSTEGFRLGFIAQEVETIFPEVIKDMPDGTKAMSYTDLIAVLVEAIKEQQVMIENMQQQCVTERSLMQENINNLQQELSLLQKEKDNTKDNIENTEKESLQMRIFQNIPNPFSETTSIHAYIPINQQNAQLCIYDVSGALKKCITVTDRGNVNIQIISGELPAGIYIYLLQGDGQVSEAKQMIITQ